MSKTNYAITEIVTNPFGELQELAVITVDMSNREITGTFSARVITSQDKTSELNPKNFTPIDALELEVVLPILVKLLNGKKLASHTGLDVEGEYINNLLKKKYGFDNIIARNNIIDSHVLVMRFIKGLNPEITKVAEYLGIKVGDTNNALQKAYMTHGILRKLFDNSNIRQHTYKTVFAPIVIPEIVVPPVVITEIVEKEVIREVEKEVEKIVYVKVSIMDTIKSFFSKNKQ